MDKHEKPVDRLRSYATVGARVRLDEIEEERADILEEFPELGSDDEDPRPTATKGGARVLYDAKPKTNGKAKPGPKSKRVMDPMTAPSLVQTLAFVENRPSVTVADVAKRFTISSTAANQRLSVMTQAGRIKRVDTGVYAAITKSVD